MKYVYIKIYELENCYKIKISLVSYRDKRRLIEKETIKYYTMFEELKMFLNYYEFSEPYKHAKIYLNYFSNSILLETLSSSNNKSTKINDKIEELYNNFNLTYDVSINEYNLKNRQKYASIIMVPKKLNGNIINKIQNRKVFFSFDLIGFQAYLDKCGTFFKGKFNLFIQVDNNVWNFYEFLSGKLTRYVLLNEMNNDFKKIRDNIFLLVDKRYDEIIIDSDFKTYLELSEEWKLLNVIYSEYYERFKLIDEKKFQLI